MSDEAVPPWRGFGRKYGKLRRRRIRERIQEVEDVLLLTSRFLPEADEPLSFWILDREEFEDMGQMFLFDADLVVACRPEREDRVRAWVRDLRGRPPRTRR